MSEPRYGHTRSGLPLHAHVHYYVEHLHPGSHPLQRLNRFLAFRITRLVGTMWCAYLFAALALVSFSQALRHFLDGDTVTGVAWLSQAFLQLVLLPVIIVGQNQQNEAADARIAKIFEDVQALRADVGDVDGELSELSRAVTALTAALTEKPKPRRR